ncbi:MAG TPA: endolytic transglycosylase MltG [Candidatus Paceibacterota bacterium]
MEDTEQIGDAEGEQISPRRSRGLLLCTLLLSLLVGGIVVWKILSLPPADFPVGVSITVPSGASLYKIAELLKEKGVIRSEAAFTLTVRYRGAESRLLAGDYLFSSALSLSQVVGRLVGGVHGIERMRITIPEGTSVAGMGRIFKKTFLQFDDAQFVTLAGESEGYLFPDTYFFFSTATSGPIIDTLKKNFLEKTDLLYQEATANKKSWSDLVIMASIIEEETVTPKDRRIVSGILWKRLAKKMPLQVDAPFAYDIGKNSETLTLDDLKIDSPYNTYRNYGLPPTPISNPGLDAIDAALHPETSPYFFYLSGKDGVIYYAKTFEEHKLNKERYLR